MDELLKILDWLALNVLLPIVIVVAADVASRISLLGYPAFAIVVGGVALWIMLHTGGLFWWIVGMPAGRIAVYFIAAPFVTQVESREAAGKAMQNFGQFFRFVEGTACVVAAVLYGVLAGAALFAWAIVLRPVCMWLLIRATIVFFHPRKVLVFHNGPLDGQRLRGQPEAVVRISGSLDGRGVTLVYGRADLDPRQGHGEIEFDMVYIGYEPASPAS
jgi:hypothetical protein